MTTKIGETPTPGPKIKPLVVVVNTSDHKRLEVERLPDGRVMIATWVSNKRMQSYFVLGEEELATLNAVIEALPDFVRIYCGRIGSHPAHIWATQDDKQVSCVGIDPYAVLNRIQDKHKENSDEPTGT